MRVMDVVDELRGDDGVQVQVSAVHYGVGAGTACGRRGVDRVQLWDQVTCESCRERVLGELERGPPEMMDRLQGINDELAQIREDAGSSCPTSIQEAQRRVGLEPTGVVTRELIASLDVVSWGNEFRQRFHAESRLRATAALSQEARSETERVLQQIQAQGTSTAMVESRRMRALSEPSFDEMVGSGARMLMLTTRHHLRQMMIWVGQIRAVRAENINLSGLCTSCNTDLFFSFRREGTTGRFAAIIGLASSF